MTEVTQGELIPPPARANKYGYECPAWCAVDHHAQIAVNNRNGQPIFESTHKSGREDKAGPDAVAWQAAVPLGEEPQVQGFAAHVAFYVNASDAQYLAMALDAIAGEEWKPEHLRQLAARIRAAAAVIKAAK